MCKRLLFLTSGVCLIADVCLTVDATVKNGGTSYYLIKDAPIPAGGSLELIDGGSKVVLQSGDSVEALASATNSIDCILSVVDSIST